MKSIEASGKSVNEAIKNGLAELGCDTSEVDIEVLQVSSPGFFGMFGKPAKVRLTVKAKDPALDIEMPVLSLDAAGARKPRGEKRKPDRAKNEKVEKVDPVAVETAENPAAAEEAPHAERKPRSRNRGKNRDAKSMETSAGEAEVAPIPIVEHEPFVAIPEDQQSETAKRAKAFLSGLTERMGVPVEIAVAESEEQLRMPVSYTHLVVLMPSTRCFVYGVWRRGQSSLSRVKIKINAPPNNCSGVTGSRNRVNESIIATRGSM